MKQDNFATGTRKNATAKVWLIPGQTERSVNDKAYDGLMRKSGPHCRWQIASTEAERRRAECERPACRT